MGSQIRGKERWGVKEREKIDEEWVSKKGKGEMRKGVKKRERRGGE